MRFFLLIGLIMVSFAIYTPASAQTAASPFTDQPVCSELINSTGFTVYGSVETARATLPDGTLAHFKSNFRLSRDETTRICARGPFFEGEKVILTLRSLLPVFECQTKLGQPITLTATPKEPFGYDWRATCYE